jgi:hypothetical protein
MINIILLSSEVPKGMKSYGPRAIIPIGKPEEPLVIKQIKKIKLTYGSTKHAIHVVNGFECEKVEKVIHRYKYKNINFIYDNHFDSVNNTYGLIKALKNISGNNFLIVQSGVVGCYKPKNIKVSSLGVIKTNDINFNIGIRSQKNKAIYMFYDLENTWSEIAYIGSEDYDRVMSLIGSETFESKAKSLFLFETINGLIENDIVFDLEIVKKNTVHKYLHYKNKTYANIHNKYK